MQPYPEEYKKAAWFRDRIEVFFRPIQPNDAILLGEFFRSHSERTILFRYFSLLRDLTPAQTEQFVNLDFQNEMAIVGLVPFERRERLLCVGRYFRNPSINSAEIAITVHDDCQRQGMGTFLLKMLIGIAREHGIGAFTADVLADNRGMMRLLRKCADKPDIRLEAGVYHVSFPLRGRAIAE